jgi:Ca-activated chloride channel family protein
MNLTAQPTFEKVRFDEPRDAHLVVSLTAPEHDQAAGARVPVCVIPVLDVSGSMAGAKLHFAKQSILKLVDHLAPGDLCGVVTFSSEVTTLAPPAEMTPARKDALKAAVGRLAADANTNLAGGMLAGLEHANAAAVPAGMRVRVILFTDGQANAGVATEGAALVRLLRERLGAASLSAFGYGEDADQDLLRQLSDAGRGNYAYVGSPEDALTAFARELGGLLSTYAQAIEVRVTPREGALLTDVLSDVDAREQGGSVSLRVPDLLAGEVRHLVLGLRLAPRAVPLDAPVAVADVEVTFERLDGGRIVREQLACKATVRFVAPAEAQPAPTPEVDAVVAVAQLVRAQIEAEEAARRGDYGQAGQVMVLFQHAVVARGHDAVGAAAGRIADGLRDEAAFGRTRAYRSSMRKGSTRGASSKLDDAAEADLRAMGRGQGTAAQARMEDAFGAAPGRPPRTASPHAPGTPGTPQALRAAPSSGRLDRKRSRRW